MNIHITWFSLLREQADLSEESFEFPGGTAKDLYSLLSARHRFTLPQASLRVAVNDGFSDWDTTLSDQDRLVFIAPVGGG